MGAAVEVVENVGHTLDAEGSQRLVEAALRRFGRIDAATAFGGWLDSGPFVESSIDDLRNVQMSCIEAPYNFMRAVVPVMINQGSGQVLAFSSAYGVRPVIDSPLYSAARAAAIMLMRNVAAEVAGNGVQVNSIGPNNMNIPEQRALFGEDPRSVQAHVDATVPMGRLGELEELAQFAMAFLDGKSTFVTGQYVSFDGGWAGSALRDM